jgi:hypothetical protein
MRKLVLIATLLAMLSTVSISTIQAQGTIPVTCGDVIEGEFLDSGSHRFSIRLTQGTKLLAWAERDGSYSEVSMEFDLYGPRENRLTGTPRNSAINLYTDPLPESGLNDLKLYNADSDGGDYILYISCVDESGSLISNDRFNTMAQCGNTFSRNFPKSEVHRYFINLNSDDILSVLAERNGSYSEVSMEFDLYGPRENRLAGTPRNSTISLETDPLPRSGLYHVNIYNSDSEGGDYNFYISCVQNGRNIQAGTVPVASNNNTITLIGDFQGEVGCPSSEGVRGDWSANCTTTQMNSDNSSYSWQTTEIPQGTWEVRVTESGSVDDSYGENGSLNGDNIRFSVDRNGQTVTFTYNPNSHELDITVR